MIILRPNVKLSEQLSKVIWDLSPYTGETDVELTSGIREPIEQLHLIGWYAKEYGIYFPEFDLQDLHGIRTVDGIAVATWQRTWSRLLHFGIIINPPLAAECLEYSLRPDGSNRKGEIIPGSPHGTGKCFDLSGKAGLDLIAKFLADAKADGVEIRNWIIERKNNAVHVNTV